MRTSTPADAPLVEAIPHLPGSLMSAGEPTVTIGQANTLLLNRRDDRDVVMVFEGMDGFLVGVLRLGRDVIPLAANGTRAIDSSMDAHIWFHEWAMGSDRQRRFLSLLEDGQCAVGAWCVQAVSAWRSMVHDPFVLTDIIGHSHRRMAMEWVVTRAHPLNFCTPRMLHCGAPISTDLALLELDRDVLESSVGKAPGMIYRLERDCSVELVAQWVRPSRRLLFLSGGPVWNQSSWTREAQRN